jgi:hypothetical protein
VDALRPEFADRVAFVTADMSTAEGQTFAFNLGVGETTLLFFDRQGAVVNKFLGAASETQLRRVIETTFAFR